MLKYALRLQTSAGPRQMTEDNADLFFRCHSAMWSVDHLRPSEALNELCKLLFAKTYDERVSSASRFAITPGDPKATASSVKTLYQDAVRNGLEEQAAVGVLNEPIELSDAAIYRVVELLQPFGIIGTNADVKGAAFQQLTEAAVRSGMGQYFTPEPIIRFMVSISEVSDSDVVLDPFCGSGHFLVAAAEAVEASSKLSESSKQGFGSTNLLGIEKDAHMARVALTDVLLHGSARVHLLNRDALLPLSSYEDQFGPDVAKGHGIATLILTNPPFGKRVPAEAMASLGKFELESGNHPTPLEVLGLERAISFLRPGGRLAIVLPHSVLTNRSLQKVREYVAKTCRVLAIISLPPEAFARHAGVGQASILYLERREHSDLEAGDSYAVYCATCTGVGYDHTGRPHGVDELPEIAFEFLRRRHGGRGKLSKGFTVGIRELIERGFGPEQHLQLAAPSGELSESLGTLCSRVFTGVSPGRGGYSEAGVRVLKVGDLTGEGIDWKPSGDRAWVGEGFAKRHADKRLENGDILLTAAAHQRKYIGMKVDVVDEIRAPYSVALCSGEVMVLRPRPDLMNPYYLLGWLRTREGYSAIQSCVRGQTAHLYADDMRKVRVPLPPNQCSESVAQAATLYTSAQKLRNQAKEMTERANLEISSMLGKDSGPNRSAQHPDGPKKHQRALTAW